MEKHRWLTGRQDVAAEANRLVPAAEAKAVGSKLNV